MLEARRKAAPVVYEFKQRLLCRDEDLELTLQHAYTLVMNESVRNGIISTCRELNLWPPQPPPAGILADDYTFQDLTASLEEIAQRAYNDEHQRNTHEAFKHMAKKVTTASFLSDFAHEVAIDIPFALNVHADMLQNFMTRVEEWVALQERQNTSTGNASLVERARNAFLAGISSPAGPVAIVASFQEQVKARWTKNWETTDGTLMNVAIIGLAALAGLAAIRNRAGRR